MSARLGSVNLCVMGPVSTALFGGRHIDLPAGVELRTENAPIRPAASTSSACLYWCVADALAITPDCWRVAQAYREAGAVVLVFIVGDSATAPPGSPTWFLIPPQRAELALVPQDIVWASLGHRSHIALDWFDLRSLVGQGGKGRIEAVTGADFSSLLAAAERELKPHASSAVLIQVQGPRLGDMHLALVTGLADQMTSPDAAWALSCVTSGADAPLRLCLMWCGCTGTS
jgi:hypothetical protein